MERRIKKLHDTVAKRGSNVHVPVLNSSEHVFSQATCHLGGEPVSVTKAAYVHTPAQPLPEANTATMRQRWSQWSCLTSQGVGARVGSESLEAAMRTTAAWKSIYLTRDNLVTNDCLVGLEYRRLAAAAAGAEEDAQTTLESIPCISHSAVLTFKPILQGLDGLDSTLVTLGHVLEAWRVQLNLDTFLGNEVDKPGGFQYRPCDELPADCVELRNKHSRILDLAAPARSLTEAQCAFVLDADNGAWDVDGVAHWCVRDSCPLRPSGRSHCGPRRARQNARLAVQLMAAGGFQAPLKYRWKGFDVALAWTYRASEYHGFLQRSLAFLFPRQAVERAEAELAAAVLAGRDGGPAKNVARGGDSAAVHSLL